MVCYAIGNAVQGLSKARQASLVLEDGTEFRGFAFGATVSVPGEVGKVLFFCLFLQVIAFEETHQYLLTCDQLKSINLSKES